MTRYAHIKGGRVANIVEADAAWAEAAAETWIEAPSLAIGDAYAPAPKRAGLAAAITAEQHRRRTAATLRTATPRNGPLTQALDARTLEHLRDFGRLWAEGRVEAAYTIAADQGACTLSAGQIRLIQLAADAYLTALPQRSAALQAALASTADADLDAFDPAAPNAWPPLSVVVDLSAPPAAPGRPLAERVAALEARLSALEAAR